MRGNALYGTDGKGNVSPIVTSSNGVRQGAHDLSPGSKLPAGALDALVGELAVTDGNGTVVGSLAVSGVEQGDGYVLFTLQSGRCALVAEGVEGGAAVDVDCDEAIAAVEAPTSGDRRLLAALEHGPAGRRLLGGRGRQLLQYRFAVAQARAESAEADLATCEEALAEAAYQAMANNCQDDQNAWTQCMHDQAALEDLHNNCEDDLFACVYDYDNCDQQLMNQQSALDTCEEDLATSQGAAGSAEADLASVEEELASCVAGCNLTEPGLNQADANDSGPCGSTLDNPCLAGESWSALTTCCNEGCCANDGCEGGALYGMCIMDAMLNGILRKEANHCWGCGFGDR